MSNIFPANIDPEDIRRLDELDESFRNADLQADVENMSSIEDFAESDFSSSSSSHNSIAEEANGGDREEGISESHYSSDQIIQLTRFQDLQSDANNDQMNGNGGEEYEYDVVKRLTAELHEKRVEISAQQLQLNHLSLQVQALLSASEAGERERDDLSLELTIAKQNQLLLETRLREVAQLEQVSNRITVDSLRGKLLEGANNKYSELLGEYESLKTRCNMKAEEDASTILQASTTIEALKKELYNMSHELSSRAVLYEARHRRDREALMSHQTSLTSREKDFYRLQGELQATKAKNEQLEQQLSELSLTHHALQREHETLRSELETMQEMNQNLNDDLNEARNLNLSQQTMLDQFRSGNMDVEEMQIAHYQQISSLRQDLVSQEREVLRLRELLATDSEAKEELNDWIRQLQSELQQKNELLHAIQHQHSLPTQMTQMIRPSDTSHIPHQTPPRSNHNNHNGEMRDQQGDHHHSRTVEDSEEEEGEGEEEGSVSWLLTPNHSSSNNHHPQKKSQRSATTTTLPDSTSLLSPWLELLSRVVSLSLQWTELLPIRTRQEEALLIDRLVEASHQMIDQMMDKNSHESSADLLLQFHPLPLFEGVGRMCQLNSEATEKLMTEKFDIEARRLKDKANHFRQKCAKLHQFAVKLVEKAGERRMISLSEVPNEVSASLSALSLSPNTSLSLSSPPIPSIPQIQTQSNVQEAERTRMLEERISRYEGEIALLQSQIDFCRRENEALLEQHRLDPQILQDLEERLRQSEDSLQVQDKEVQRLKLQQAREREEVAVRERAAEEGMERMVTMLRQEKLDRQRLENQLLSVQTALGTQTMAMRDLTKQSEEVQQQKLRLEQAITSKEVEHEALMRENEQVKQRCVELEEEVESLKGQIADVIDRRRKEEIMTQTKTVSDESTQTEEEEESTVEQREDERRSDHADYNNNSNEEENEEEKEKQREKEVNEEEEENDERLELSEDSLQRHDNEEGVPPLPSLSSFSTSVSEEAVERHLRNLYLTIDSYHQSRMTAIRKISVLKRELRQTRSEYEEVARLFEAQRLDFQQMCEERGVVYQRLLSFEALLSQQEEQIAQQREEHSLNTQRLQRQYQEKFDQLQREHYLSLEQERSLLQESRDKELLKWQKKWRKEQATQRKEVEDLEQQLAGQREASRALEQRIEQLESELDHRAMLMAQLTPTERPETETEEVKTEEEKEEGEEESWFLSPEKANHMTDEDNDNEKEEKRENEEEEEESKRRSIIDRGSVSMVCEECQTDPILLEHILEQAPVINTNLAAPHASTSARRSLDLAHPSDLTSSVSPTLARRSLTPSQFLSPPTLSIQQSSEFEKLLLMMQFEENSLTSVRNELKDIVAEKNALQHQKDLLEENNSLLSNQLLKCNDQILSLQQEYSKVRELCASLLEKDEGLLKELQQREEVIVRLEEEKEVLVKERDSLQQQIHSLNRQLMSAPPPAPTPSHDPPIAFQPRNPSNPSHPSHTSSSQRRRHHSSADPAGHLDPPPIATPTLPTPPPPPPPLPTNTHITEDQTVNVSRQQLKDLLHKQKQKLLEKFQKKYDKQQHLFEAEKQSILQMLRDECREIVAETNRLLLAKRDLALQQSQVNEIIKELSQRAIFSTPSRVIDREKGKQMIPSSFAIPPQGRPQANPNHNPNHSHNPIHTLNPSITISPITSNSNPSNHHLDPQPHQQIQHYEGSTLNLQPASRPPAHQPHQPHPAPFPLTSSEQTNPNHKHHNHRRTGSDGRLETDRKSRRKEEEEEKRRQFMNSSLLRESLNSFLSATSSLPQSLASSINLSTTPNPNQQHHLPAVADTSGASWQPHSNPQEHLLRLYPEMIPPKVTKKLINQILHQQSNSQIDLNASNH